VLHVATENRKDLPRTRHGSSIFTQSKQPEAISLPYKLAIPFLYIFGLYGQVKKWACRKFFGREPKYNVWFIDGLSINSRRVKEGQARWGALNAVYNFNGGEGSNTIIRLIDTWWLNIRNAQAVRNRLKIVKKLLTQSILQAYIRHGRDRKIRIMSLAAGSAQAVLEVAFELLTKEGIEVEILLIDHDPSAVAEMKERCQVLGLEKHTIIKRGLVEKFDRHLHGFQPDIIEMCGYMDYFSQESMTTLSRRIKDHLPDDGVFLTCHVHPNHEAYFLQYVVNWWMWYKTLDEFKAILSDSGYTNVRYETEVHKIHTVAMAKK